MRLTPPGPICHHSSTPELCIWCIANPPAGWYVDRSSCSTCHRSRQAHDHAESLVSRQHRHPFTPTFRKRKNDDEK